MKSKNLLLFFSLAACVVTVILWVSCTGCKSDVGEGNAPNDTLSLRIACLPTLDCLPFHYAVRSGLCDSLGLPLYIKTFQAQFDADTALLGRGFDGGVTDAARQTMYQRKGKMKSYTAFIPTDGSWTLISNGALRLKAVDKLKGRTIATARFSVSDAVVAHLKDSLRFQTDDFLQPQINHYRLRREMLNKGQVDAAVLPEPFATWALQQGGRSLYSVSSRKYGVALYVKNPALSHRRKAKQLELLKRAYNLSVEALNHHPSAALDSVLLKTYKLPQSVVDTLRLPRYRKL